MNEDLKAVQAKGSPAIRSRCEPSWRLSNQADNGRPYTRSTPSILPTAMSAPEQKWVPEKPKSAWDVIQAQRLKKVTT